MIIFIIDKSTGYFLDKLIYHFVNKISDNSDKCGSDIIFQSPRCHILIAYFVQLSIYGCICFAFFAWKETIYQLFIPKYFS